MVRNIDPLPPPPSAGAVEVAAPPQFSQRTAGSLDRPIDDAITQRAGAVEINMSAVQALDSFALNWILAVQTRLAASNIPLRVTHANRLVEDILVATRLDVRLAMHIDKGGEFDARS